MGGGKYPVTNNLKLQKMQKTELITAMKPVMVKGVEKIIVTTESGATIWINKSQMDNTAETITYSIEPAGSKYIVNGVEKTSKDVYFKFEGFYRQIIKKMSTADLYKELAKSGIVPSIVQG